MSVSIHNLVVEKARAAKEASKKLAYLSTAIKNRALNRIAAQIEEREEEILEANSRDVEAAKARGLSPAMIDRLLLDHFRIKLMADGVREVVALPDPVGEVISMWRRPNGLLIGKMRVPIGVIGFIYEARPNATVDAAVLSLKAGNAVMLRGGSEAFNSNLVLTRLIDQAACQEGIPPGTVQFIDITDHQAVREMLKLNDYIDLIIPRGGEGLIRTVVEEARVPVIFHYKGNCHIYVDRDADLAMAEDIAFNAKVQRPAVCNAMETLLVNEEIAPQFLPRMIARFQEAGVEIRGCEKTLALVPGIKEATPEDWEKEYLALILAVKVVKDLDEAIQHINRYTSGLSEAIITNSYSAAQRFLQEVDSAVVYVNASTRLTDGNQFGLGAEIGISTQKLHARGPMGLVELTTYKYIVYGSGQVRE